MNFLKRIFSRFHPGDHWRTADGSIVKLLTVGPTIGTLIGGNTTVRYNSKGKACEAGYNLVKKLLPEPGDVWISKHGHKTHLTNSTKGELEGMFENSGAAFKPTLENLRTLYLRNHHDSVGSQYITTLGRRIKIVRNMGSQSKGVDLDTNETVIISSTGNLWSNTPDRLEKSVPTKGVTMTPLKVGQVWNTARGLARILRIEQGYSVAWVFGSDNGEAVRFREGPQKQEHDYLYSERLRLESLHSEPLTLEKGKRYKAANGKVGTVVNVVEETYADKPGRTLVYLVKFDDLPGRDSKLYYAGGVFKVCDSWTLVEEMKEPEPSVSSKSPSSLEFKVGHSYLTADGDTLKLIQKTTGYLLLDGVGTTERRSLEGRYYLSNGRSSPKDLVKEAPQLALEVGHTYTDASGTLTYKVVATDAPVKGYPVVAYRHCNNDWTLVGLTSNGQISSVYTHVMDAVKEVKCQANTNANSQNQ